MASKYSAFGTILARGDGTTPTEVFTAIAGVRNIPGPDISTDEIDVTAHDSPGGFEEIIPTIKRSGSMALEVVYDPADTTHLALKADYDDRKRSNYKLTMPSDPAADITFAAFVTQYGRAFPYDGMMALNCTLRITGEVVG